MATVGPAWLNETLSSLKTRMFFVECANAEGVLHLCASSFIDIFELPNHLFNSGDVQGCVARPFVQNVIGLWQTASLHIYILDEGECLSPRHAHLLDYPLVPNSVIAMPSGLARLLQLLEHW